MKYNLYYGIRLHSSHETLRDAKNEKKRLNSPKAVVIFYHGRRVG